MHGQDPQFKVIVVELPILIGGYFKQVEVTDAV